MMKKCLLVLTILATMLSTTACAADIEVSDNEVEQVCTELDSAYEHTCDYISNEMKNHCDECTRYEVTGMSIKDKTVRAITYHSDGTPHYSVCVDMVN